MATLNRSLVVVGEVNKKFSASGAYDLTSSEETATVVLHFKSVAGISPGSSMLVRFIPTDAHINDDVLELNVAYLSSTRFASNFAPEGNASWFVSQPLTIPPGYTINVVDVSGAKITCSIMGTKFRNFAN